MTTTRRFFLLLACACIWSAASPLFAQTPTHKTFSLEKWRVSAPPREGSPQVYAYNNNFAAAWQVFLQNGRIAVSLFDERKPEMIRLPFDFIPVSVKEEPKTKPGSCLCAKKYVVKVADGWISFLNAGEWGGRVDWFSPDGSRHYKISSDQVVDYAQTPDGLFAVQGLGHLSTSCGTLIKLEQDTMGKWKARTIVDLKDAPDALLPEAGGTFLVVTSSKLLRVNVSVKTVTPLLEKTFWGIMYPNSLVAAPNGDLYIGMRGGVVRALNKRGTYQVQWLTPPAR